MRSERAYTAAGSHLQARPSRRYESERYHRVRQPRQIEEPRWLRGTCADIGDKADRARRREQIPHQRTPRAATKHTEPVPVCAAQHQ
ncbi:hypothetical protein IG631_00963 [Alternaria alternata]|nr:hypothetical protein IG631_00963 [Alternaria alternata]